MNQKPLILVTNDDGIASPGLLASIRAVRSLGELLIVAPETQQTSLSRAYPRIPNLGVIRNVTLDVDGVAFDAYSVTGSPAFCVAHAVLELANRPISLCISGVNYGENIGLSIMSSGTIGAAFEADSFDIPALAVSLETRIEGHHSNQIPGSGWDPSIAFVRMFSEKVIKIPRVPEIGVWNINIPAAATGATEWRMTRQSRQNYLVFKKPGKRDRSRPFTFEVAVEVDEDTLEPDSDIHCLIKDQLISVTPLRWNLTAEDAQSMKPGALNGRL